MGKQSEMRPGRLALPPDVSLYEAVMASFRGVLSYAGDMVARVPSSPTTAVHEYRKAIRRARSVTRLLRPVLSKTARRSVESALKEAHRSTSSLRNTDVLVQLLDDLDRDGAAAALRERMLSQLQDRRATRRLKGRLERGLVLIRPLPDALDAAMPDTLSYSDLIEGFRRTYLAARRELRRAQAIADPEHIHGWRKRTKDLSYQLELLATHEHGPKRKRRKPYAKLAETLGAATDSLLLAQFLRQRHERDGDDALGWLADEAYEQSRERWRRALRFGAPLFEESPRAMARSLRR